MLKSKSSRSMELASVTQSFKSNRAMERANVGLEKIVARSIRLAPPGEGPLLAWPLACGSGVAGRTRAVGFSEGILRVEVADKAWRAELQALASQYLAVLNRYVAESVKRIEFVVAQNTAADKSVRAT